MSVNRLVVLGPANRPFANGLPSNSSSSSSLGRSTLNPPSPPPDPERRQEALAEALDRERQAIQEMREQSRTLIVNEFPVSADLVTSAIVADEEALINALANILSGLYRKPENVISVSLHRSGLLLHNNSFAPSYILSIYTHASLCPAEHNNLCADFLSRCLTEKLHIQPDRGTIKFLSMLEGSFAVGGRTFLRKVWDDLDAALERHNAAVDRLDAERQELERLTAERLAAERLAAEAEREAMERAALERLARLAANRDAFERAAAERAAAERAAEERAAEELAAAERAAEERAAAEALATERAQQMPRQERSSFGSFRAFSLRRRERSRPGAFRRSGGTLVEMDEDEEMDGAADASREGGEEIGMDGRRVDRGKRLRSARSMARLLFKNGPFEP